MNTTSSQTAEEKARQLGARIACEAFNACGSLDARKCQELGDDFGTRIAELVAGPKRLPPDKDPGPFVCFMGCGAEVAEPMVCYGCEPLSTESRAALAAGLESARRGDIRPLDLESYPMVGHRARETRPWKADALEPSYMRCFVCGKHRGGICGHDTCNGAERRWYCSRECGDR